MTLRPCCFALGLMLAPGLAAAADPEVTFEGVGGVSAGTATLSATRSGVLLRVELSGMPPSAWIAMHIHENPACDHSAGHQSAGGHFNPAGVEHGWLSESGPHAGDLPNIRSDAEGRVSVDVLAPLVTWEEGPNSIRGRALIVHEKPDDYKSQPTGDAGARLACAVILAD